MVLYNLVPVMPVCGKSLHGLIAISMVRAKTGYRIPEQLKLVTAIQ
jgi:hypothetical protein